MEQICRHSPSRRMQDEASTAAAAALTLAGALARRSPGRRQLAAWDTDWDVDGVVGVIDRLGQPQPVIHTQAAPPPQDAG